MSIIPKLYNRLVNFGIKDDWDLDRKRSFHQVNEFNAFLFFIAFSAWPIALGYKVYYGFILQFLGAVMYLTGFYLIAKEKLREARLLAIYTFETHMFLISFFALLPNDRGLFHWYSPVFITFMLYPLVAALFDKPVFKHMLIALFQIVLLQFIGGFLAIINFPTFPIEKHYSLNIIVCFYTIGMASALVYLIHSENRAVKNLEIERSKELEKALKRVEIASTVITKQADDLAKMNESKNKFFSIIAHDLKSPYNTVLGFSEILKNKSINDPEYYLYAKNLYDTALDNYNLLENLLEWSRSQMDHIQYRPICIRLNDVILKTINLIGTSAEKKNISIENNVSNTIFVNADRNLINIIFRNIITNSIKFTVPGGKVVISTKAKEKFVEVSIADNGIGIPESIAQNLFAIENKESRKGTLSETGTGLGLILCKEFVELHGGKIWVESQEHKGSTFFFTLPECK